MAASIDKWTDKLLDLGKRNRLINFKDSKTSTIDAVLPDSQTLFDKIASDTTKVEIFDTDAFLKKLQYDQEETQDDDDEKLQSRMTKIEFTQAVLKKIKPNQTAFFNKDNPTEKVLKELHKRAKESLTETGINILYLAFGFIRWIDQETPNTQYYAPLVLVPVKLIIKSATAPIRIQAYEDQPLTNPTFTYKLLNEFNVNLPQYEDGSLHDYFLAVEDCLRSLNWTVVDEVKLGTFSFLKMNMYLDLKNNQDIILQNDGIKRLIADDSGMHINPDDSQENANEIESATQTKLLNVVDADSSQAEAIRLAKDNQSFVLQGPPGTGKSQTITNIIAECMAEGKKVLFVSEKLAALNVVYNNLKRAGLNDFCLELYSHKTNKKEVIAELNRTLSLAKSSVSNKAMHEMEMLDSAKQQLDDYADELHKKNSIINMSAFELYNELSKVSHDYDLEYLIPNIQEKNVQFLNNATDKLSFFSEYSQTIGYDYKKNYWYGYTNLDASYQQKFQLKKYFETIINDLKTVIDITTQIHNTSAVKIDTLAQSRILLQCLKLALDLPFHHADLYNGHIGKMIATFEVLQQHSNAVLDAKKNIDEVFEPTIYDLDCYGCYQRYTKYYTSFFRFLNKDYKNDKKQIRLHLKNPKKQPSYQDAIALLADLKTFKTSKKELADKRVYCLEILSNAYDGENTDWSGILSVLRQLQSLMAGSLDLSPMAYCTKEKVAHLFNVFVSNLDSFQSRLDSIDSQTEFTKASFDKDIFDLEGNRLNASLKKFEALLNGFGTLDNWIRFWRLYNDIKDLNLIQLVDNVISKELPHQNMPSIFKKLFYKQWIYHIYNINPILSTFERITHDKNVQIFSEKDKLQFEIAKAQINAKLSAQRPNTGLVSPGSDVAVLLREGEKKRKQMPVRMLFSNLKKLALVLKPCFLMSPLSVSTYLDPTFVFDVVIFDEASQIYPEDAVGAIYRAKQVIVVGDSKQMPPSNFFMAAVGLKEYDNDEDDNDDTNDFESILDICSASYKQKRLKWHYRSKTDELIAFSNKNFYKNELVTFPSAQKKDRDNGIDFHYVKNGTFDRKSKTNMKEAEYIAELVFDHYKRNPNRSLGVVAFSQSQQDCIDNMIAKKRQADSSYEKYFSDEMSQPFFIKNLETVQGDERDTIIFSVGYAKDSSGRFIHNFGPLNKQGGERRLNVAITRAKSNVKLVSSINSFDIDLSRSNAEGTRLLKEYLDYAENGNIVLQDEKKINKFSQTDYDFETEIYAFLKQLGYHVDMHIGCSSYKIDVAVKDRQGENYVVAIECDGVLYHNSKSTRDRDRLRREVLERLGWRFYRIWSTDWIKNNQIEKQRLEEFIEQALQQCDEIRAKDEDKVVVVEEKKTAGNSFIEERMQAPIFKDYVKANDSELIKSYKRHGNLQRLVLEILDIESPVSQEWLLKRIISVYGREKVTNVVINDFTRKMSNCPFAELRQGFWYLKKQSSYQLRVNSNRDIKYIAIEEIAAGLYEIIKQNVEAEANGLIKVIANQLGFGRLGEAIQTRVRCALDYLSDKKLIRIDEERITVTL